MQKNITKITSALQSGLSRLGNKQYVLILVLLIMPSFVSLLKPGFFFMQDDLQAFRIHQMYECFKDGQIPCRWVPDAGYQYGYPQFNFYPPSVYYAGVFIHMLGFQIIDAVKIMFIAGYILSALFMYLLLKEFLDKWSGLVGAVLYTYAPYKALEVYVRGAMSEFWSFVIFPLTFWASYKYIKQGKTKHLLWFSASIALLLTTHNLMPIIFLPVLGLWIGYWLIAQNKVKLTPKLFLGSLLGLGLASYFFLPVLFERQFVHVESVLSGYFDYRRHFVDLYRLFISNHWGYGSSGIDQDNDLSLSTGLVHWLVGVLAVVLAYINRKKHKKLAALTALLSFTGLFVLFLIHQRSSFIWEIVPILKWLQFPWRFLSDSIFLLAILSGLAVYFTGKYKYLVGIVIMAAAIILYTPFFRPKDWKNISDKDKFSGQSWEKQLTISIFDYTPIYAKLPPPSKAPDTPEVLQGEVEFVSYTKGSNFQKGVINVKEDAILRAPLFDFPGMQVKIDGKIVEHRNDDCTDQQYCLGLITFPVQKGDRQLSIRLTNTPIRNIGNTLTLISALTFTGLFIKTGSKDRKNDK